MEERGGVGGWGGGGGVGGGGGGGCVAFRGKRSVQIFLFFFLMWKENDVFVVQEQTADIYFPPRPAPHDPGCTSDHIQHVLVNYRRHEDCGQPLPPVCRERTITPTVLCAIRAEASSI